MRWTELIAIAGFALAVEPAGATTLLPGFEDAVYAPGLTNATAMGFAPDGRLFVCEQAGALRVVEHGTVATLPLLSLTVDSNGERGLLGIAFDPDFPNNRWFYVYYTMPGNPPHNRVSRFTESGDTAIRDTELVLMDLDNLSGATNHNGGAIHFGADGKLYIAVGENAKPSNAQTLTNRLGKLLRINKDGSIPADNPFYSTAADANRSIWALGLRNPFTFAVHPRTGRLFINDVGQSSWEEINDGIAGANYGWPNTEGISGNPAYRDPLYAYNHNTGNPTGCAITGGTFYSPGFRQFPAEFRDRYFFADLCSRWIWAYDPAADSASQFATGLPSSTVDLQVGPDGSLYYLEHGTGGGGFVGRIRFTEGVYRLADATAAVRVAAGLDSATPSQAVRLNVDDSGPSAGVIDLADALHIARQVAG